MQEIALKELLEGCREKRFHDSVFFIDTKMIPCDLEKTISADGGWIFHLFNFEFVVQAVRPGKWYILLSVRKEESFTKLYDLNNIGFPEVAYRLGRF